MTNIYVLIVLFSLLNINSSLKTLGAYPNHENYEIIKVLGENSFKTTYQVYNRDDNKLYVIKKIKLNEITNGQDIKQIQNEAKLLTKMDNKFITKYYE